jgi:hypothetical protein
MLSVSSFSLTAAFVKSGHEISNSFRRGSGILASIRVTPRQIPDRKEPLLTNTALGGSLEKDKRHLNATRLLRIPLARSQGWGFHRFAECQPLLKVDSNHGRSEIDFRVSKVDVVSDR